jgi:hypothetical protein
MTTFTTQDREEEEQYLRLQIKIQQDEIDRLNGRIMLVEKERDAYQMAYSALLNHNISKSVRLNKDDEDFDMDGRC